MTRPDTNSLIIELLPCPFCGDSEHKPYVGDIITPWMSKHYAVSCDNCGATAMMENNKEDAVEAWNKRAQ